MVKTTKRTEIKSVTIKTRINKGNSKNNKSKWLESNFIEWSSRNGNCNVHNVERLNEILRFHRNRRTHGRRAWKVAPKDSLEVYREKRRRRQLETDDDDTQSTDSQKPPRKDTPQTKCRRKRYKREKRRRRSPAREPCPLCHHNSCSCSSTSNNSDMEY